jgi:hypothetical protein
MQIHAEFPDGGATARLAEFDFLRALHERNNLVGNEVRARFTVLRNQMGLAPTALTERREVLKQAAEREQAAHSAIHTSARWAQLDSGAADRLADLKLLEVQRNRLKLLEVQRNRATAANVLLTVAEEVRYTHLLDGDSFEARCVVLERAVERERAVGWPAAALVIWLLFAIVLVVALILVGRGIQFHVLILLLVHWIGVFLWILVRCWRKLSCADRLRAIRGH